MNPPNAPKPVPDMEAEPALTIGGIFANKVLLKAFVAAMIAMAAKIWNLSSDDDLVTTVTDFVFYIGIFTAPIIAQLESRQRANQQAEVTRGAVYAPSTVKAIRDVSYEAGTPPTEPKPEVPPPNKDWGVYNIDDPDEAAPA